MATRNTLYVSAIKIAERERKNTTELSIYFFSTLKLICLLLSSGDLATMWR